MADDMNNLVIEHLRAIRAKQDDHDEKLATLTQRVGSVEKHLAVMQSDLVEIRHGMDRFDRRLERIENRLDIVEEPV